MKKRILPLIAAGLLLSACDAMQSAANDEPDLETATDVQKYSYAVGMDIGSKLDRDMPLDLQAEYLAAGIADGLAGEGRLDDEQFQAVMEEFLGELEVAQQEKAEAEAEANRAAAKANLAEGEAFLAENAKKEGVQVTDSGLQYKVLEEGDGPKPEANDQARVHYEGRLIDGTVFDSSRERGEPVTFPLNAVIPGWSEGVQLMSEGARYRLFVPPELAYGDRAVGEHIGPNETLIFDVELLTINPEPE